MLQILAFETCLQMSTNQLLLEAIHTNALFVALDGHFYGRLLKYECRVLKSLVKKFNLKCALGSLIPCFIPLLCVRIF